MKARLLIMEIALGVTSSILGFIYAVIMVYVSGVMLNSVGHGSDIPVATFVEPNAYGLDLGMLVWPVAFCCGVLSRLRLCRIIGVVCLTVQYASFLTYLHNADIGRLTHVLSYTPQLAVFWIVAGIHLIVNGLLWFCLISGKGLTNRPSIKGSPITAEVKW
jgi:hypothetical protein